MFKDLFDVHSFGWTLLKNSLQEFFEVFHHDTFLVFKPVDVVLMGNPELVVLFAGNSFINLITSVPELKWKFSKDECKEDDS